MNISEILKSVLTLLGKVRAPLVPVPAIMLSCTSARRCGLSAIMTAAGVISDLVQNDEENGDVLRQFITNVAIIIKQNILADAGGFAVVPPGGFQFLLEGANAGGAITALGQNENFVLVYGIIR